MTNGVQEHEGSEIFRKKRRVGYKKGGRGNKKMKLHETSGEKVKMNKKMKKLFQKRARDYNSDDDDSIPVSEDKKGDIREKNDYEEEQSDGGDHQISSDGNEFSEDEGCGNQPGISKFLEGCNAFKKAFTKITQKSASDDVLDPVLSAHKKLVAEKLAEEDAERKVKGEAKKEKPVAGETGHVKPKNYLDSHDKFLLEVATKGVVKLFNAVYKAQNAQKGLNPSRSKDAKVINKRKKRAFFSELARPSSQSSSTPAKIGKSTKVEDGSTWAPLQDNYMLTSAKLKDWDKMEDTFAEDALGRMPDSSSDED